MLKVKYHCPFKANSTQIGSNLEQLVKEIKDTELTPL